MNKIITKEDKEQIALSFGIEYKALNAIFMVESAGSGFDPHSGIIKIQFEPYWFQKYTGIRISNGVENQSMEWLAYNNAVSKNKEAAMLSTSWGLGQVMGFNHKAAGYSDVALMVSEFNVSEKNQLLGMLNFIKANPNMYNALRNHDWATFAYYYNGEGYKQFNYDARLIEAYNKS